MTPPRARCFGLLAALLLLASCASPTRTEPVDAGAPADAGVPTLPPVAERHPDLYDEEGCALVAPDEVDCSTTAGDLDRAALGSEGTWRSLASFEGPRYLDAPTLGEVVVLADTVVVVAEGTWSARGLVRNETDAPVGAPVVRATLLDGTGATIGVGEATSPVAPVRAGEPAPFAMSSDVPAAQVASVRWSVEAHPDPRAERGVVEIATWWQRDRDDSEPVDLYLYRDEPGAPVPPLLFGAITNRDDAPVAGPRVVGAWVDGDERVLWLAEVEAVTDPAAARGGLAIEPGASADFLFVLPADAPAGVDGAGVMLWVVAA